MFAELSDPQRPLTSLQLQVFLASNRGTATLIMGTLPYIPHFILPPNKQDEVFYFQPSAGNSVSQLLALDTSGTLNTSNITTTTVTNGLPFVESSQTTYLPFVDEAGNIIILAGDCKSSGSSFKVWKFAVGRPGMEGTWTTLNSSDFSQGSQGNEPMQWLSGGMSFTATENATSDMYLFGGLCPNSFNLTVHDWQASADYSNSMFVIEPPSQSSTTDPNSYDIRQLLSRGPPIPEAGLSMTPLSPTFLNSSDGNITQQQNFVLLGGHTKEAFINMSQIALFSLPEQSWAFLPINPPASSSSTELSIRDSPSVDPRSGHTALLMENGRQIVVLGGWVGNVSIPASPQLAILELGEGFGGDGDWQWVIPDQHGSSPIQNQGIYGHGAVMLPGDVMMVVGGYSTANSPARRKRASLQSNLAAYFYNVTSGTWLPSYTNPLSATAGTQAAGATASSGKWGSMKKVGLGAGLGLGLAALILAILFYSWYSRRLRRRRDLREKELRELALGTQMFHSSELGMAGIDGRGGEKSAADWMGPHQGDRNDAYPWASNTTIVGGRRVVGGTEAERTGLLVEIPSPTRGLRRSLYSRRTYQQPPWYDDSRRTAGSGQIHVIDERDEEDEGTIQRASPRILYAGVNYSRIPGDIIVTAPNNDPFRDPVSPIRSIRAVSRSPSPPSPARERALEVQNWVSDWNAADAIMQHQQQASSTGRVSPDKTDRTSSTISEQSVHSIMSYSSIQRSIGSISRSMSQRSAALLNFANPHALASPTSNQSITTAIHQPFPIGSAPQSTMGLASGRSRSLTIDTSRPPLETADSFCTARTSFTQLQSEGSSLLYGTSASGPQSGDEFPLRTRSRTRGWMGSVRRALLASSMADRGSHSASPETSSSSPTRPTHGMSGTSGLPRRAASAGAMLWRRRQGARDWDVENGQTDPVTQPGGDPEAEDGGEEEWDVESAVERRVVQVMFTVPRERLRIVNGGPEGDGESMVSVEKPKPAEQGSTEGGKEKEQ